MYACAVMFDGIENMLYSKMFHFIDGIRFFFSTFYFALIKTSQ